MKIEIEVNNVKYVCNNVICLSFKNVSRIEYVSIKKSDFKKLFVFTYLIEYPDIESNYLRRIKKA